ncbi:hypothetical protein M441DRAFT_213705 [Trichoderma asperellum CBS 433.97]|uniref:Uncharacterized protein n=1 Tax=Trichoderma asperellum (strain ATCC 204424 / CBS 433.97 / NBRC 101777) TaxID=1042311 RepID=A0A2T3ZND9_TRIA4|nr:hypothetical protein M441DRAFT_213705 [Trichoderma asperellum CBS 433.97]PTB46337.1 hypothetical protein M441DRAFT_213705 [Trichoderma asperellum CBS 433.97]
MLKNGRAAFKRCPLVLLASLPTDLHTVCTGIYRAVLDKVGNLTRTSSTQKPPPPCHHITSPHRSAALSRTPSPSVQAYSITPDEWPGTPTSAQAISNYTYISPDSAQPILGGQANSPGEPLSRPTCLPDANWPLQETFSEL